MKLAIVSTHPIQYNAPFFRLLAAQPGLELRVFYTWEQSAAGPKYDPGFGRKLEWDIPLLDGYDYEFVKNTARDPGSHHFRGIVNPDLIRRIENWAPDLLLVYGWSFRSHLACLRHFHGKIPVWFRGDSTLLDEKPGWKRGLRRILLRWVYSYVDRALYVGKQNKDYFLAHGLRENQLSFVPHAIDNRRFAEPAAEYESQAKEWRKQLGIPEVDRVILFAGKLEPKKNPFFVLQLARALQEKNIWFVITGNGPLETALKAEAAGLKRVLFLDFQNQSRMPVLYRLGDVFILPSAGPGETWGLAVNEAMACARPVLVSERCGCAADLLRDGENGLLLDPGKPDKLVPELLPFLQEGGRLQQAGRISAEMIGAFSFESGTDSIVQLLAAETKAIQVK